MSDAQLTSGADGMKIVRRFDAAPDAVYRAWTEPEAFAHWWGGTQVQVPIESVSMDVRVGGRWTAQMLLPDGNTMDWSGVYLEVSPPHHLAYELRDQTAGEEFELIEADFAAIDGGTELTMRQSGGHLDADGYARVGAGWMGFFDALAELL